MSSMIPEESDDEIPEEMDEPERPLTASDCEDEDDRDSENLVMDTSHSHHSDGDVSIINDSEEMKDSEEEDDAKNSESGKV